MLFTKRDSTPKRKHISERAIRKQKTNSSSLETDSKSPRRTYADMVSQGSSSDTDSPKFLKAEKRSTRIIDPKCEKEATFDWNKIVVLTRRYFHNDWRKIIVKLKEQLDTNLSYQPFHADKALIFIKDKSLVRLLCKNRGWSTVGNVDVKFEEWNHAIHAMPRLMSSYGGWTKFRGIPLHAWNLNTFTQIRNACGGFMEVTRETRNKVDLIEAVIKIKYNYTVFIPATISVSDDKGNKFLVQTVVKAEGRWLKERSPRIH